MQHVRFRSAVAPLRRGLDLLVARRTGDVPVARPTVDALVAALRPTEPLHCLRPAAITATAREFLAGFPGTAMYAVKCNPEPAVLRALWEGGVRHFDCASIGEVALVRQMFADAEIHFMHPVKARPAIAEAFAAESARVVLVEQLYRAFTILKNHPYHLGH